MFVKGLIMEVSVICEVFFSHRKEALGEFWTYHAILLTSSRPYSFGWNLENPRGIIFSTDDNSSFQRKGKWQILSCHNKPSEILEAASSERVSQESTEQWKKGCLFPWIILGFYISWCCPGLVYERLLTSWEAHYGNRCWPASRMDFRRFSCDFSIFLFAKIFW